VFDWLQVLESTMRPGCCSHGMYVSLLFWWREPRTITTLPAS